MNADMEADRLRNGAIRAGEHDGLAALSLITATAWWQTDEARGVCSKSHDDFLRISRLGRMVDAQYETTATEELGVDWALLAAACELRGWRVAPLVELVAAIGDDDQERERALNLICDAIRIAGRRGAA